MLLSLALAAFSQWTAHTPAIRDENGNVLPNSVAELIALRFHGRKQWISIRGVDQSKPVLLFLAGGPGEPSWRLYAMSWGSWKSILW